MANDMMQDPSAAPGQTDTGYEICIKVDGAGKISVGVDMESDEAAQGPGTGAPVTPTDDDSSYHPVRSIKEAMQVAMDIYKNSGQMVSADAGMDDFNSGFGQNPTPAPKGGM